MKKSRRAESGFTLIEIVIAVTLSAVIFAILLSAMRLSQRSQEKGTEREESAQKMRIITDRLSWLIRGAYPYTVKTEKETLLYFNGADKSLGFVTTSVDKYSGGPEDAAGLKWVGISAGSEGLKIKESVYFLEKNLEGEGGREYVFDKDVKSISLEYLDVDKETGEKEWVSEWEPDKKDYLPYAVRVGVSFELNGKKIEIPMFIIQIRNR